MAESAADQNQLKMVDEKAPNFNHQKHSMAQPPYQPKDFRRSFCTFLTIFLLLAALTALILWLIYRPHKPQFTVVGATLYDLNTTSPPFITTALQFTLLTRNPNKRVSIIYEKLSAFVSYKNQPITTPVDLPPLYHETKSTVAVSPVLGGDGVPVSLEAANGLAMDEMYGVVELRVVLFGRLRWKAGGIKTKTRGVKVECDILVGLKKGVVGPLPLLASPHCDVHV